MLYEKKFLKKENSRLPKWQEGRTIFSGIDNINQDSEVDPGLVGGMGAMEDNKKFF